jgi:hypothetical protein
MLKLNVVVYSCDADKKIILLPITHSIACIFIYIYTILNYHNLMENDRKNFLFLFVVVVVENAAEMFSSHSLFIFYRDT